MIDVRIQFLFNILRMNGQNLTKFCIHIINGKIYVVIVNRHFSQICNRVTALDWRFFQYLDTIFCIVTLSFFCKDVLQLLNISLSSDRAMAGL